jgi:aspartokinase/homoserine dehydrogenase 1
MWFYYPSLSEHSICIGILNEDAEAAEAVINRAFEIEILQHKIEPCIEKNLCIIALVGENMKITKLSGKMFSTLGKTMSISEQCLGASERNIC